MPAVINTDCQHILLALSPLVDFERDYFCDGVFEDGDFVDLFLNIHHWDIAIGLEHRTLLIYLTVAMVFADINRASAVMDLAKLSHRRLPRQM